MLLFVHILLSFIIAFIQKNEIPGLFDKTHPL